MTDEEIIAKYRAAEAAVIAVIALRSEAERTTARHAAERLAIGQRLEAAESAAIRARDWLDSAGLIARPLNARLNPPMPPTDHQSQEDVTVPTNPITLL